MKLNIAASYYTKCTKKLCKGKDFNAISQIYIICIIATEYQIRNQLMNKYVLLIFGMCLFAMNVQAQSTLSNKQLSYNELFKWIQNSEDTLVRITDVDVVFDQQKDRRFAFAYDNHAPIAPFDTIFIDKAVYFERVTFGDSEQLPEYYPAFHHIHWQKPLHLVNVSATSLDMLYSVFDEDVYLDALSAGTIKFLNLNFSRFSKQLSIRKYGQTIENIMIYDNSFQSESINPLNMLIYDAPLETIQLVDNEFSSAVPEAYVFLQVKANDYFSIGINTFDVDLVISGSLIDGSTAIMHNTFNAYLALLGVNFSPARSRIEWEDIKNKLVFVNDPNFPAYDSTFKQRYLKMDNLADFGHTYAYRALMPMYRMIHQILLFNEPRRIANDCYIDMKNLEKTEKLYFYKNNSGFANYFDYQLHRFIGTFSDYGTKPAKGIVVSLYVILFFAAIYFLFPNSWDSVSNNKLINRIQFFVRYFEQDRSIGELYTDDYYEKLESFKAFKNYMKQREKKVPNYILLLARPIYYSSIAQYRLTSYLLSKLDVMKGKWESLSRGKKITTSFIIGSWLLLVISFDLGLKALNAITLSINTFTTLGFGDIPISGLPRYMAVLEGFIGWFLLSIFSVSLIYQVLN
jgi:hypothetical protein